MCEIAFSWWCVIQFRRLVLLIFLKISGKQMAVYHSEFAVLRCCSGMVKTCSVFWKKQATICLDLFRSRTIFVDFGSLENTHTVDCIFPLGSHAKIYDLFLSRCYKRVLKHRYRNILTFFSIIQDDFFFWQTVWDPTWTNVFPIKCKAIVSGTTINFGQLSRNSS